MRRDLLLRPSLVTAFVLGLILAAGVVRLPVALAQPGGPNHPVEHDCLMKSCFDVKLIDPECIDGECATPDDANKYRKCFPVEYERSCNESSANGGPISCGPYYCNVMYYGQPRRKECGFWRFYPCG